eukprot:COSAG01_NODE_6186_length_3804_cov_2.263428_5_plen_44_part_00
MQPNDTWPCTRPAAHRDDKAWDLWDKGCEKATQTLPGQWTVTA